MDARPKGNLSFCLYVCRCFLSLRSRSAAGCYGVSRETGRRRRRRSSVDERRQRGEEDEVGSGAEPGQHQVNREHGHNSKNTHVNTVTHNRTYVSVRLREDN